MLWSQRKNSNFARYWLVWVLGLRSVILALVKIILIFSCHWLTGHDNDGSLWHCLLVILAFVGGHYCSYFGTAYSSLWNDVSVWFFPSQQFCRCVPSVLPFPIEYGNLPFTLVNNFCRTSCNSSQSVAMQNGLTCKWLWWSSYVMLPGWFCLFHVYLH